VEEMLEMEEMMKELLGNLVEEDKGPNLLLYRWLERGVEFLSSLEDVLREDEWKTCLLHPADDDDPAAYLHLVEQEVMVEELEGVAGGLYHEGTLNFSMLTCTLLWYLFICISWLLGIWNWWKITHERKWVFTVNLKM
jgi:hypothetical protein